MSVTALWDLACFDHVVHLANDGLDLKTRIQKQFDLSQEDIGCKIYGQKKVQRESKILLQGKMENVPGTTINSGYAMLA